MTRPRTAFGVARDREEILKTMKRALKVAAGAVLALAVAVGTYAETKPAIGAYCPGAYVKMGKAVKGDPRWSSKFNVTYHGYCATGVAMGKKIASNPELFTVEKGVTYLFSSAEAKAMFDKDPAGTIVHRRPPTAPPEACASA